MENKKGKKKLGLQKIKITTLNQNRLYMIKGGNPMLQTYTEEETGECVYGDQTNNGCGSSGYGKGQCSGTCRSNDRGFCENV